MNIILGYLGILHLGHPAIYGIGAYAYAILSINAGFSFFPALLAGGFFAMLAGLILSIPALRLKSHYVGMATLAFLIIVQGLLINMRDLTRGALGIPGIPKPTIFGYYFGSNASFLILSLILTTIICFILHRVMHSPFSKIVETIKEDETASKTIGKNTIKYKIQAFMIASFFAGIGGGLLASYLGFINPTSFDPKELIIIVTMVIIGGMASFWGSILGAALIILLPEPLRFIDLPADFVGPLRYAIYGLILILFMIFKPNGILGKRTNIFSK